MSEISNILLKGEKVLWEGKPNLGRYSIKIVFFIIFFLIFLILGIFSLRSPFMVNNFRGLGLASSIISLLLFVGVIYQILLYRHVTYAITSKRIIIQAGVIGRDYKSIDFDKIQNININVGLLDKILKFNTGSIEVKTAGVNVAQARYGTVVTPELGMIAYVGNPYEVAKILGRVAHLER